MLFLAVSTASEHMIARNLNTQCKYASLCPVNKKISPSLWDDVPQMGSFEDRLTNLDPGSRVNC